MDKDSQLVREALQARLLVELMSNSLHKELVLKGGLAMRAVHGSVRLTKDIDLDADSAHSRGRIHGIVVRSISDSLRSGLIENASVTEPKQTDTTMRWKIAGTAVGTGAPFNLTIEVSRRPQFAAGNIVDLPLGEGFDRSVAGSKVRVLDSQALAFTKVLALTDPKRVAPRDLYDLYVLIEANVEPPVALLAGQPVERIESALAELWSKVESMNYQLFRSEVLTVMPDAAAQAITEDKFADMQLTVCSQVEKWLKAARAEQGAPAPTIGGSPLNPTSRAEAQAPTAPHKKAMP